MALRLSKGLGRTAESWLAMQDHYNLTIMESQCMAPGEKPV